MSYLKCTTITTKETRARNHRNNSLGGLLAQFFQLFPRPLDVPVDGFEGREQQLGGLASMLAGGAFGVFGRFGRSRFSEGSCYCYVLESRGSSHMCARLGYLRREQA